MANGNVSKKIMAIIWPFVYFILILTFCISGCLIFHSTYYHSIFVSGTSMSPTLLGTKGIENGANFGIIDTTEKAKENIKRFNVVTTYFPFDKDDYGDTSWDDRNFKIADGDDPEYKIKRVIAMGGETVYFFTEQTDQTFNVESSDGNTTTRTYPASLSCDIIILEPSDINNDGIDDGVGNIICIYGDNPGVVMINEVQYTVKQIPYQRKRADSLRNSIPPTKIDEGRYFIMGDNWASGGSLDSASAYRNSSTYDRLTGENNVPFPVYYDNIVGVLVAIEGTCKIYTDSKGKPKCVNRHYFWPIPF